MISQTDINKLKTIFPTKEEFNALDKKVDHLAEDLHKRTDELIELITAGLASQGKNSYRIDEQYSILNNHESRIERLEERDIASTPV